MLALDIAPNWEELGPVSEQAIAFLRDQKLSDEFVDAMTMTCCELLENALKYGPGSEPIKLHLYVEEQAVTVAIKNYVADSNLADLHRLDAMIQWIRGFQDPFQAYIERLKAVSAQNLSAGESGLGLVRIAYEGHAILDFFLDENQMLNISAVRLR
jgi:hypothetical protein